MRRKSSFFWMLSILMVFAIAMTNCTKEGPAGPAGADGADGTNGTDGTDGVDGNSTCLVCHTQANMDAIAGAFNEHKHVVGSSWARGTSGSCARCHAHEGFMNFVMSGESVAATVSTPLECASCHNNHASLEEGIDAPIYSFATVPSVAIEGASYDHGKGNLCASCHQARRGPEGYDNATEDAIYSRKFTGEDVAIYQAHGAVGPNGSKVLVGDTLFVTFDVPTSHVYTSSTHAGPHHGPQANIFAADIGTVTGAPFDRDHHTDCAGCHLSLEEAGSGHTFVPDMAFCNDCHGDALDIEADMAAIAVRMDAVEAALENIGAIHVAEDGVHPMYASLPRDQWNAFWNFMCLWEDSSNGVHNFNYAKQLLNEAENALGL